MVDNCMIEVGNSFDFQPAKMRNISERCPSSMGPALNASIAYSTLMFLLFFVNSKHYFLHSLSDLQHVKDLQSSLSFIGLINVTSFKVSSGSKDPWVNFW